jgi:putative oxidoreductase
MECQLRRSVNPLLRLLLPPVPAMSAACDPAASASSPASARPPAREGLWFALRLLFGALFLYSGVVKLLDPITFADDVRNYRLVGDPIAPAMALFIPWLEVFAGIGIMLQRFARGSAFLLVAMLVAFTAAIGVSWARGLDITCGCFGSGEPVNYPVKILQNLALLALGIWLWWREELRSILR